MKRAYASGNVRQGDAISPTTSCNPVHGGHWIVKLPSLQFPAMPETEYAMLQLARAVGIDVPESRLVPIADIRGLPQEAARMAGNPSQSDALTEPRRRPQSDSKRAHFLTSPASRLFEHWPVNGSQPQANYFLLIAKGLSATPPVPLKPVCYNYNQPEKACMLLYPSTQQFWPVMVF
jgi:hypothetical protein